MKKKKLTPGDIVFNILIYTFFTLFAILCIFPFYYIFINTISDNRLVATGKILFRPLGVHFGNYIEIMKIKGLARSAGISVARTILGTTLTVIASSFLGYTLSKKEMWHRKLWYRFVVISMYFNAGLIPWYLTMKNLGLTNNFLAYILPSMVAPFYLILFKTYIESIPPALEEAAQIDGAGYFTRFVKIILPMTTPIMATIAVFASVDQWNSFVDTLFLMNKSDLYTLQFMLYKYLSEVNAIATTFKNSGGRKMNPSRMLTPTSIRMTVSIVVVLPILFVYPFFQRYFVKGIMVGAVKG